MAEKRNPLGATGETVASNVKRIREAQRLPYAELSRKLSELGRPIATLGLSRIENGERRVDADDLVALSVVLGVTPVSLLMPHTDSADDRVSIPGLPYTQAKQVWRWLTADPPVVNPSAESMLEKFQFYWRAMPPWVAKSRVTLDPDETRELARRAAGDESRGGPDGNN